MFDKFKGDLPVIEIAGDCEAYQHLKKMLEKKKGDFKFFLDLEKHARFNRTDVFCLDTKDKGICDFLICMDKKIVCVFSMPFEENIDMSTIVLNYFFGKCDSLPKIGRMFNKCQSDCTREKCCRVQFEEVLFKESVGSEEAEVLQEVNSE